MPGLTVRTSKSGGVHLPSLMSKESSWLAPPFRKRKMQYSAPPRGVTFSFAETLSGRTIGASQKPETVTAPVRKKWRRVKEGTLEISCGIFNLNQSIVVQKFGLVDQGPRKIFESLIVPLFKGLDRDRGFGGKRRARKKRQEHLLHNFLIVQRRIVIE